MRSALQPVLRLNLADDLTQRIRQFIQAEKLKAGDRLPTIASFAADFGVGAPTVREALKTLEAIGAVDIRHGSGVFVGRVDDSLMISNPVYQGTATKKVLVDLIEARIPVETLSATLAAQHANQTHLREMTRLLTRADDHLDNDTLLNETNLAFHRQIAVASGNTVVRQMLEVLTNVFTREQRMILDIQNSRRDDHDEHRGILAALKARNAALAAKRMRLHLTNVQRVLEQWDPVRTPLN